MKRLALAFVLLASPALAQTRTPTASLMAIGDMDVNRTAYELHELGQRAMAAEASLDTTTLQRNWWEDACRSTPACGGKPKQ